MVSKCEPGRKAGEGVPGRGNSMGERQRLVAAQSVQVGPKDRE